MQRLPQNLEAECGVLGAMLVANEVIPDVAALLQCEDFYLDVHQVVYRGIAELYDAGEAADPITVANHLKGESSLKDAGGFDFLHRLADSTPHAANATYHAGIVRGKATARRGIEAASGIIRELYAQNRMVDEVMADASEQFRCAGPKSACGGIKALGSLGQSSWERFERRTNGEITGIWTGYDVLDNLTDGLQPEDLIVIAGRPSMGKSAFAMNICENLSVGTGVPSLFVSLEMGEMSLYDRVLTSQARVDAMAYRTGAASDSERYELRKARERLDRSPLYLVDRPRPDHRVVQQVIREAHARHGIKLAAIDYLQLVHVAGLKRDHNRTQEIDQIMSALKDVARECKIPILVVSQLNREVDKRTEKRPFMSDLRESGAIEQTADLIGMLYRPNFYDASEPDAGAELIIAKNRNGATGTIDLSFIKQYTRFENPARVNGDPPLSAFTRDTA